MNLIRNFTKLFIFIYEYFSLKLGKKLHIVLDLDNTSLDLHNPWIKEYNEKYNDNLSKEDIKGYDIHNYVSCGDKIYDIINNSKFFEDLEPFKYFIFFIKLLFKAGYKITICSAAETNQIEGKITWLRKNLSFIPEKDWKFIKEKYLIHADIIIDDWQENFINSTCKYKILFDQPWNQNCNSFMRVFDWKQCYKLIKHLSRKETLNEKSFEHKIKAFS